ncbi:MAG: AMIN domain-containing protein, partial [Hydrogenophaga sp.]
MTARSKRRVARGGLRGGMALLLMASCAWAQAQNAIKNLTGSIQGGTEIIRIETQQPLAAAPTGFTVQSPARISLDFPGVINGIGRNAVDINQGNMRSAHVVQAGERTRVVINLKQPASYQTRVEGTTLLVVLDHNAAAAAAPAVAAAPVAAAAAATFAPSQNPDVVALKDIDFRRGAEATGRVVVDLGSNQVGVDIRQQGQDLVVEFLHSSLPEGLRRRLDVS